MTAKAELADNNERLWMQVQRLTNELIEANAIIRKLTETPLEATSVITADKPIGPKMVIGIVQCPKCGQLMEVEK